MDSYEDNTYNEEIKDESETTSPSDTYKYAGFWMRFWAYLIDVIIVFSINGILLSPLKFMNDGFPLEVSFWTLQGILAGVTYYLYFLLMTKIFQQTVGKMIFGIKVVRENNNPPTWGDLFFREVIGRFIYNALFILKLLYLVVAFTDEKQGLHDMIGETRVIHVS